MTKKSNYVNYLNFYNFSKFNEIYRIREIISPQNIHIETLKFIDYLKDNFWIAFNPENNNKLHYIKTIASKEEKDSKKIKIGKEYFEYYEDKFGFSEKGVQSFEDCQKQIDDYGYIFDINAQNVNQRTNIVKYDNFDNYCVTIPDNEKIRMRYFLLP